MAPGIILLIIGAGLALWSAQSPGSPPNEPTGDDLPDENGDIAPIVVTPVPIVPGITINPYGYHEPIPGVDYVPLGTDIDITQTISYERMKIKMDQERESLGAGDIGTVRYSFIMFATGWNLLANFQNGKLFPSVWQVMLAGAGLTPLEIWNLKSDAVTALGVVLHGQASERPPGVPAGSGTCGINASFNCNFNWSNPPSNANYVEVRNFLTGYTYATPELLAAASIDSLDSVFLIEATIQMIVIWRNDFNNVPPGSGNFNFPH